MNICFICKSSKKDDIQYGEFLQNKHFGVHTFCLYLSSNLLQNGDDDEGFLGFLETDIKNEVQRISLLRCCYCHKSHANIGCCEQRCRKAFHLICGLEHHAENRFCKDYRSYCHKHVRKVVERPSSTETCLICFENVCAPGQRFNHVAMILTPCCRNGWFHKFCLQKFAKTAGYFFKCPLCNDDKIFREKLPAKGIFIPNQDAAWELEPNAFAELLERPNECSAHRCKNKKGRKAKSDNNPFLMCHTCGSIAIHKLCLNNKGQLFSCTDCSKGMEERDSGFEGLNLHANQNDEYIDVCHVGDKEDLEIINRVIATSSKMSDTTDSSDNEELPHTTKKCRQLSLSESSDGQQEISSCSNTKYGTETVSSSDEQIYKSRVTNGRIILDETKTNKAKMMSASKGNSINVFNDSSDDDDTELENLKTRQPNAKVLKSKQLTISDDSSNHEEIPRSSSGQKRKSLIVLSDSEDDIFSPPKQQRLSNENIVKRNYCSIPSYFFGINEEEDEDSDNTSDSCAEIMEKEKTGDFSTKRTKKTAHNSQAKIETDNKQSAVKTKSSDDVNKTRKATKKQNNLDISCIAKRTRRRTICCGASTNANKATEKPMKKENQNVSCIALRTRRKSICGRTDLSKQNDYKMLQSFEFYRSRIYDKLHDSNDSIDIITDDEDYSSELETISIESSTETDLDNFIVDDGYKQKGGNFDISCIANRTRKRKSLKGQQRLTEIIEESDCSSGSIMSLDLCENDDNRCTINQRALTSSKGVESEPSTKVKTTHSIRPEKYPAQNFTSTFKINDKKTESFNAKKNLLNYHPSSSYHPHSSNRYRV